MNIQKKHRSAGRGTGSTSLRRLETAIRGCGRLAIAFSGGVDSTFLAAVAQRVLGDRVLLVTARSPMYPAWELAEARALARELGMEQVTLRSAALEDPRILANPPNRCYLCKKQIFAAAQRLARRRGFPVLADGTNADDRHDYRPGHRAAVELGVRSPLQEAGLGKAAIRALSRRLGLPTAGKPSVACLASRIPYGQPITPAKLKAVYRVEERLRQLGFAQVRVRHHGDVARIEVEPRDLPRLCAAPVRDRVRRAAAAAGFLYVAADLAGYRTGSLNAALRRSRR